MAVARMKKVTVLGHRCIMKDVVSALQDMGCVQVINLRERLSQEELESLPGARGASAGVSQAGDVEERLSRVSHCISYLGKFETQKRGLIDSFVGPKERIPSGRFERAVVEFDETPVYEACLKDEQASTEARAERARLDSQISLLEGWADLDIPVEELGEGPGLCVIAASCAIADYGRLEEDLAGYPVHLERVSETVGTTRFVVFYLPGYEEVTSAFAARGVSRASFADLRGTPEQILGEARSRLLELDGREEAIKARGRDLIEHRLDLQILHDHLAAVKARGQMRDRLAETDSAFALEGWVKARNLGALKDGLERLSDTVEVFAEDPSPEDDVPVSLENHPLVQPFEIVTNIYGFPKYNEQDPTPLLAPFFFVFFGLALTDAAYGIALAVIFWYLMKKYRVPQGERKFYMLMIYCGISTTIFGAMAGGWFGNLFDFLPKSMGFLKSFRSLFFVFDPMEQPLTFMAISLALGVFQVWFGILVKLSANVRAGAVLDGLMDQVPWLVLIPSLVLMAVTGAGVAPSLSVLASRLSLGAALAIVVTQGRNTKNIFLKPFTGLYALYGGVGYFSDVLSYTRLLALGLATGVIGNVINQIGDLARSMIPGAGIVIMVTIMVGGHAFNLFINVIGAFIHSGRLQFVEFFTKFFEGGGKGFKPFKKETKYVTIE